MLDDGDASVSSAEAGPTWSDIARWYEDLIVAGSGPHETATNCLLGLVPALDGAEVLDLGCGQGLAVRALARAGAKRVTGIDLSEAMIELARAHGYVNGCDVSYAVGDAQHLAPLGNATFDGVTCQLALMDFPDLDASLAEVHRVLRPGGWFVFIVGHPCFLVPDAVREEREDGRPALSVCGYFQERFWRSSNPSGVRRAGTYHRTLSTYLNALLRAHFSLEEVAEPIATGLLARQQPAFAEVPIFFCARARRR